MKENKGITLIALVITIIILIILAGISISLLMGENGIITKAKQGALNYQNATLEEQVMLNNFYGDFATGIASATGDLSTLTHVDNVNAATSDKILKDYKAYVNGQLVIGTMNDYSSNPEKIVLTAQQKEETTINVNPGYYDKIIVDASAVYDAGTNEGIVLQDINPTKDLTANYSNPGYFPTVGWKTNPVYLKSIEGYDKVAIYWNTDSSTSYYGNICQGWYSFILSDGTKTTNQSLSPFKTWSDYIDIPDNAVNLAITVYYYGGDGAWTGQNQILSILTKDSPYNPDNL